MNSRKSFKKQIRGAWDGMLPEPGPFPFEEEFPEGIQVRRSSPFPGEGLLRCAGVALFIGLFSLMTVFWGNPGYSPAGRSMDGAAFCHSVTNVIVTLQNETM